MPHKILDRRKETEILKTLNSQNYSSSGIISQQSSCHVGILKDEGREVREKDREKKTDSKKWR